MRTDLILPQYHWRKLNDGVLTRCGWYSTDWYISRADNWRLIWSCLKHNNAYTEWKPSDPKAFYLVRTYYVYTGPKPMPRQTVGDYLSRSVPEPKKIVFRYWTFQSVEHAQRSAKRMDEEYEDSRWKMPSIRGNGGGSGRHIKLGH